METKDKMKILFRLIIIYFAPMSLFAQNPSVTDIPSSNRSLIIYNDNSLDDLVTMAICAHKKLMGSDCSRLSKEQLALSLKYNRTFLDGLFERALDKICQKDVKAAINNLKIKAHFYPVDKNNNPLLADSVFYYGLAIIKYLIQRDETNQDPNLAPLREGYKKAAIKNVSEAIALHSKRDYAAMQKKIFEALWIVYPVTSTVPFKQQSVEVEWNTTPDNCSPELKVGPTIQRVLSPTVKGY